MFKNIGPWQKHVRTEKYYEIRLSKNLVLRLDCLSETTDRRQLYEARINWLPPGRSETSRTVWTHEKFEARNDAQARETIMRALINKKGYSNMDWKVVTPDPTDNGVRAWELNMNRGLCLHLEYKSIAKYVAWMTEKLPTGENSSIWCSGNFSADSDNDAKKIALNSIYDDKEKQKAHLDAIVSELSHVRFERGIADA